MSKMSKWNLLTFGVVFWTYFCKGMCLDNKGTEFIIGFPENVVQNTPQMPELLITSDSLDDVPVNITAPKFTDTIIDHHGAVSSGLSCRLKLPWNLRINGTDIAPNAVYITAEQEVSVFAVNTERNSNDAFLALPTDVLGREYYAMTWSPPQNASEILLIGIYDSTTVNVHLPNMSSSIVITWKGQNFDRNDVITETIDRFDIFQIQAKADLSGTYITSDKIIGVLSGNKRTPVGSEGTGRDNLVEMLPPVGTFGKSFVTVPFPLQMSGGMFKVLASQDNTLISVQKGHNILNHTIQTAGETYVFDSLRYDYCYIRSNKPVLLMQFVKSPNTAETGKTDPSMMIILPLELYSSKYTFTTPTATHSGGYYDNYFMFTIKESEKDGLKLDGSHIITLNVSFMAIEGSDYVGGYIPVTHKDHYVDHDSTNTTYAGYLYGSIKHESYAVPVGIRLEQINKKIDNVPTDAINESSCSIENVNTTTNTSGYCECQCQTYFVSNKKQKEIMSKLKVSKKETSRYRASKISVQDNRPSAVALGSGTAICLLVIPLALIVISDIPLLIRHMRSGTTS